MNAEGQGSGLEVTLREVQRSGLEATLRHKRAREMLQVIEGAQRMKRREGMKRRGLSGNWGLSVDRRMDYLDRILSGTLAALIERLGTELGLSATELSGALAVTPRTLERWRYGKTLPQWAGRRRLDAMVAVGDHLWDTFSEPEAARGWLRESNRYLGGLTPAEVLAAGRADRVEDALEALDSGVFV